MQYVLPKLNLMASSTSYLKLVLKGEVIEREEAFEMPDGSIVKIDTTKKIVIPSKKNQQRIGMHKKTNADTGEITLKPVLLDSVQHQKWHKENLKVFREWKDKIELEHGIRLPIVRAKLKILFFFPNSMRRDLGNKGETIYDMLSEKHGVGIIADDEFKVMNDIHLKGWVKRDKPRTEIYLTIIPPDSKEYEWDLTDPSWFVKQKARKITLQKLRRMKRRIENSNDQ